MAVKKSLVKNCMTLVIRKPFSHVTNVVAKQIWKMADEDGCFRGASLDIYIEMLDKELLDEEIEDIFIEKK